MSDPTDWQARADRFMARMRDDIARTGRTVICVFGGEDGELPFAYTIGNYLPPQRALPELLVIGTSDGGFLNQLSRIMIERGAAFANKEIVSLGGDWPVKIITANTTAQTTYTVQAGNYHGYDNYPVQQVLLPDGNGHFPDDPRCAADYRVPVLMRQ
jgi:hypothetical protein